MKKWVVSKPAVVVVALLAVAVVMLLPSERKRRREVELRAQLDERLQNAERKMAELEKMVERLQSELASAAESPEHPAIPDATAEPGATADKEIDQGKALLDMFASMKDESQPAEAGGEMTNVLSRMFEGESGEQIARMTVNMYYGDLFQELKLPKDTEQQVRDIIAKYAAEQIRQGMGALKEGSAPEDMKGVEEEIEERLRDELSRILTAEEMAVYDEYQDTMRERVLDQTYEMQLSMFAGGLTPENREIVKQTIIDEMLAMEANVTQYPAGASDIQAAFDIQRAAYERARERLLDVLDEDQLTVFDQFIETQQQMVETALQMMGGLQGQTLEETPQQ